MIAPLYESPLPTATDNVIAVSLVTDATINGVAESVTTSGGSYTAMSNTSQRVEIGKHLTNELFGNLDETAIFTTELSQSDITAIYNNGEPQSLEAYSPLINFRMGDNATWNGATWTMTSVGTDTRIARSINMVEANRTTDVPPNPFENTLSTLFDGVDDRVEINRTLGSGFAELSISTWVKYNNNLATSNRYHPIVAKIGPSFGNSFQLANMRSGASSNGGELYFNVQTPDGSFTVFSGVVPSQNVWYNIVGTYDGSNVKIYIDGVLKGTLSASGNINSNTELMMLGDAGYGGYSSILNGNLDEVSIYSRGLTQSEVTSIYNSGVPNDVSSISDIEAWWRMGDGDTANTITDNVGSNNGTMVNMNASNFVTDVPTASSFTNTKSILLDGVDDFVSFSQVTYTGEFTTSFWIKPTSLGTSFLVGRNTSSDYIWLRTVSQIRVRVNFSTYSFIESGGNDINANAWNHLLVVRDASNNLRIFLNGAIFASSQVAAGDHRLDQIGKVGTSYYDGNVDETAFWDSDQSSNLATIYNSGVPNDISSLSPTLWYRMGDGDTSPTLTDNGSGGNNGTMTNFSTFSTDVPFNYKSILLDGVDDYVDCGNPTSLQITGALSISFWLYGRNNATHTGIITKTPNTSSLGSATQYHIQFQNSNRLRFAVRGCDLYAGTETTGTVPTVVAGVWQHITMTWNGSDTMTIYKDGAQVCTKVQSTTIVSNTSPVWLGRRAGFGHLLGKLDEVAIFNTELSSSNVTSIYNSGVPNDISSFSPVSWWRCGDGDTAPTLTDNGSASNDGTMTNFTTFSTDVPT